MKKRIIALLLAFIMIIPLLPLEARATSYNAVMTAEKFIECLKTALARGGVYNNVYPYNVGYYNGSTISWDCWNLGKSILWSKGEIVNNYTVGYYQKANASIIPDTDGLTIVRMAPNCSDDFSNLVPGEWLYLNGHTGYYIGDGQVIECTWGSWGARGVVQSQIDANGTRTLNGRTDGVNPRWLYHGMIPQIDYSGVICKHEYTGCGECSKPGCNFTYDWKKTESYNDNGYYTAVDDFYPRRDLPYSDAEKAAKKVKKGNTVKVIASYTNAYGNKWFQISYNNGASTGYVYHSWLGNRKPLESSISIDVTWPYEGQTIPKQSHNLMGTVNSTNQISSITGYLDGRKVAIDSVNATSFSLVRSNIDYAMPFNALSSGRHTIKLVATDIAGGTQSMTRTFYTESSPCDAATVTTADEHWGGKTVIIRCPGARISYTTSGGDSGTGTDEVRAFIKNTTTFTITTSKSGYSDRVIESTVSVSQVQAPQFETVDCYEGTRVTITSTPGAQIYYYFDGTGHGEYVGPFIETR